jgi:hypothetical protein
MAWDDPDSGIVATSPRQLQWNTHNQTNPNDEHVGAPPSEYDDVDDALTSESECHQHQQQPLKD